MLNVAFYTQSLHKCDCREKKKVCDLIASSKCMKRPEENVYTKIKDDAMENESKEEAEENPKEPQTAIIINRLLWPFMHFFSTTPASSSCL